MNQFVLRVKIDAKLLLLSELEREAANLRSVVNELEQQAESATGTVWAAIRRNQHAALRMLEQYNAEILSRGGVAR